MRFKAPSNASTAMSTRRISLWKPRMLKSFSGTTKAKICPAPSKSGRALASRCEDASRWWPSARYRVACAPHVWAMRFPNVPSAGMRQISCRMPSAVMKSVWDVPARTSSIKASASGARGHRRDGHTRWVRRGTPPFQETSQRAFHGIPRSFRGFSIHRSRTSRGRGCTPPQSRHAWPSIGGRRTTLIPMRPRASRAP